jgi:hypothetical protein
MRDSFSNMTESVECRCNFLLHKAQLPLWPTTRQLTNCTMKIVNEFLVKDKSLSQGVGTPLHAGIKPPWAH